MVNIRNPQGGLVKRRAARATNSSRIGHKPLNSKGLKSVPKVKAAPPDPDAPAKQQQLKCYEEALGLFQQQKFQRAKQSLERVLEGPSKELRDRALVHVRICDQRISRGPAAPAKSARRCPDEPGPLG
jgi:hypothetical protein